MRYTEDASVYNKYFEKGIDTAGDRQDRVTTYTNFCTRVSAEIIMLFTACLENKETRFTVSEPSGTNRKKSTMF